MHLYSASAGGNQRSLSNWQSNRTTDPLISPVDGATLADFIGDDYDPEYGNPLIDQLNLAATQMCIKYTGMELLDRDYTLTMDRMPERQSGYFGVSILAALRAWWINLPVYPVIDISVITVGGDSVLADAEIDLASTPARVRIPSAGLGDVVIQYKAGHADPDYIPPSILTGIMMLAAYLYEHRGACDATDAMHKSGAADMWAPHVMYVGGL